MSRTKIASGAPAASAADQLANDVGKERPKPQLPPRQDLQGQAQRLLVPHDILNEQIIIAAAMSDAATLKMLVGRAKPDDFFGKGHAPIWAAMAEIARQGLTFTPAVARQVSGGKVEEAYLRQLQGLYPTAPPNIRHHVGALAFDKQRIEVARGPLQELLKAMQDTASGPDVLRAASRKLAVAFDGYSDRRHLLDPNELVRQQNADIMQRRNGHAVFPFGIDGLDVDTATQQWRMVPGAAPGLMTVVTAVPGGGKALDVDTPIATPDGWTTMGGLKVGDALFDDKGQVCHVEHATPFMSDRPCYEVEFSDGEVIVADEGHLWFTRSRREYRQKRRGRIQEIGSAKTTKEIAATLTERGHKNHAVPMAGPLDLGSRELPIPPYTLGAWLGDGTSANGTITGCDLGVFERIAEDGYLVTHRTVKMRWNVVGLKAQLREQALLNAKHIPEEYFRASAVQRLDLLRGLLDTDGSCEADGGCKFTTTSAWLARGFGELLASLGIKFGMSVGRAKLYGKDCGAKYNFSFTTSLEAFCLKRKLAKQKRVRATSGWRYIVDVRVIQSRPVRCIQVSSKSKLFLAGRRMVPTHNSTLVANMALGLAEMGRRVLFGAWEMNGGATLELIAGMKIGLSRKRVKTGNITDDEHQQLNDAMLDVAGQIRFLAMPFGRVQGAKVDNDKNLDTIHGYIADSGCDVFIADLWKRCLRYTDPDDEEHALIRQQAIAEETKCHCILVQQQRFKDIEGRKDKRPTRDGIKGSGAWVEVADTILAPHRPALFKRVPDDTIEIVVLKQRHGDWPIATAFDWNAEFGSIKNGRTVDYDVFDEAADDETGSIYTPKKGRK